VSCLLGWIKYHAQMTVFAYDFFLRNNMFALKKWRISAVFGDFFGRLWRVLWVEQGGV